MLLQDDPNVIWVTSAGSGPGSGSYEAPFVGMKKALERIKPGQTIVLRGGVYRGDVTLEISGAVDRPIRIMAEPGATVEICESAWFLYDSSDLIISGLQFANAPQSALSAIGACQRNCFENVRFINCSIDGKGASTVFFGGSGARCNVVQNCEFEIHSAQPHESPAAKTIAVLVTEGDNRSLLTLNRNHVFRKNRFFHYGCGVVVGSRGSRSGKFGHVIEHNIFDSCRFGAIWVNCGDTIVRNNMIRNSENPAISIAMGSASTVYENRIEECAVGVDILDSGHTVQQNCFVRCAKSGIDVRVSSGENERNANNVFIEHNTFIDCGAVTGDALQGSAIRFDSETSSVVRRNLMHGSSRPYLVFVPGEQKAKTGPIRSGRSARFMFEENVVSGGANIQHGCMARDITFFNAGGGDFHANSEFGAQGWAISGNPIDSAISTASDSFAGVGDEAIAEEGAVEELVKQINREEILARSLFVGDSDGDEHEVGGDDGLSEGDEEDDPESYFDRDDI